jgi:hypothetical protein
MELGFVVGVGFLAWMVSQMAAVLKRVADAVTAKEVDGKPMTLIRRVMFLVPLALGLSLTLSNQSIGLVNYALENLFKATFKISMLQDAIMTGILLSEGSAGIYSFIKTAKDFALGKITESQLLSDVRRADLELAAKNLEDAATPKP